MQLIALYYICVLQVTAASSSVCGFDRRDGFIRARAENREQMPIFNSKCDQQDHQPEIALYMLDYGV